jgi:hypothetical protein
MQIKTKLFSSAFFSTAVALLACAPMFAQQAQLAPDYNQTGKAYAPFDMTGWWVAIVTEDWRLRMMTAPKGDYYSIPLTPEGRRVADQWDAERDIKEGKQCLGYGAVGIMRQPTRAHITWEGDNTMKLEMDAGKQVRTFNFTGSMATPPKPPAGEAGLQGFSVATWQTPQITRFFAGKLNAQDPNTPGFSGQTPRGEPPADTRKLGGNLKVVTTHMKPGYLRNNGVPYSADAVLTEYYDLHEDAGQQYLVTTTIVEDPKYLYVPWVTSNHFRREADGSKFDPQACELILPSK